MVSAALLHRYRTQLPVCYWKPIQTGIEQDDDTAEVRRLASACDQEIFGEGVRLPRPVSPHLAAEWAGQTIDMHSLTALPAGSAGTQPDKRWIVEGAGGALVPVNKTALMTDLMALLALPVLVVSRNALGTINHTLLTIEILRARGLRVVGIVMCGDEGRDNAKAIEHYGKIPVISHVPRFDKVTPEGLQHWAKTDFDREGRLLEFFR